MTTEKYDREQELRVQDAYNDLVMATKAGESVPIGPVGGGRWDLYCAEYLSHYFYEVHLHRRFRAGNADDDIWCSATGHEPGQFRASLNIYPEGHFEFTPFDLPDHASLEPVMLTGAFDDDHRAEVVFLGDRYIKLKVELNVLLEGKSTPRHLGPPKMVEFSGIWCSDKEFKRKRAEDRLRHPRPPSPRETIASQLRGFDDD